MSQMQTTTVDKEGRVKIPKILLEKMGLEAPATLAVGLEGGMIVMMPHPASGEEPARHQLFREFVEEAIPGRIADFGDCASGQGLKRHGPKDELRDIMALLGIDDDGDAPETMEGLIKDYAEEGENSLDIVRSVRNGI